MNRYDDTASNDSGTKTDWTDEQRRQDAYFRMMTELLDHAIWRIDLETMTVLDVSSSVKRLRGYEPEDLIGRPMKEMLTPASYRRIVEKLPKWLDKVPTAATGDVIMLEVVEQPHQDGTTVWTEMALCFFRRSDGGIEEIGISRSLGQQKNLTEMFRQLADSERFLQVIWDVAPCMLSCVDCEGRFLLINQHFADNRGIDRASASGRYFHEVMPNGLEKKHEQLFAECLTGKTVEFMDQYRPAGASGDRWSYGQYRPVLSVDGQVEKVVVAVMDVTGQQEMKRQLLEAEKIGGMGSWYLNLVDGRFRCSDGLLALYGTNRKELETEGRQVFWSRLEPESMAGLERWEDLAWLAGQEETLGLKVPLTLPDGTRRLVWVSGEVRTDANGQPFELYGMVIDITRQQAMEDAKREAELRLREFSRAMPGAGMIVDAMGTVVEVFDDNQLLDADTATAWPGKNLAGLLPDEPAQRLLQAIGYVTGQGMLRFEEFTLELARGRRMFDVRIAPLSYRREGKATAACYWTDNTNQNHTKKLLELTYEKRRQRDLLNDLAEGKVTPSQEILDQAWKVKLNLTQDFSCYLLSLETWAGQPISNWQERREELQTVIDALIEGLAAEPGVIVWESKEGIAILAPIGVGSRTDQAREVEQAGHWQEIVRQYAPEAGGSIGIAEFHSGMFWQFAKVYGQARIAVELGRKLALKQVVHHYLDIGVFQFFPAILDKSHVLDFVKRTLGRLEEYDRNQGTELVGTLEKILQTDNLKLVAKQLYVHRQTILFRKQRIEAVLGVSLDNFETRLALGMALKFRQVYGEEA
ncbi:PAS domain-containing protein [Anaerospora sp.]|uniref:PAS domain-containing protein n=1 Tax=Anaerospora sp. TaxID=1960278 RepID=UPI00289D7EB0|nr:PAS domain-containing protein [Anaerospora sp.]